MKSKRSGIIDIGSNSIRLVIYEQIGLDAHHVIDESKHPARLSEKVNTEGIIPLESLEPIVRILKDFRLLCRVHRVETIRAVATAAIRNAANSNQVRQFLEQQAGFPIEVLSGEEEARLGFVGMINTIDVQNGFVVDIGGGSTEVSLFVNRMLLHSISLPFGAVNMAKQYTQNDGSLSKENAAKLRTRVLHALDAEPWLRSQRNNGFPLIGLGGTIRSLCKIDQKQFKYALDTAHNYVIHAERVEQLLEWLPALSADKRKKVDGLSNDRSDIIIPGLLILHTVFAYIGASHYVVSGAGLRDGLFFETVYPESPICTDVLNYSVRNLLALHPAVPLAHVEHVHRLTTKMFDDLNLDHAYGIRARRFLQTAALLYRIGVTVHYYSYYKHTFYLMANSRIDGLSHREIIVCALIAAYKSKSRNRQLMQPYKELLHDGDSELVERLGSLLHLAIALDRSETQPVQDVTATVNQHSLQLLLQFDQKPLIELRELERIAKDFNKSWGLRLKVSDGIASKS
jgi:exopolyphosphatase/guanosine-5'-triphosphate,3'-diphosphate pyrophosphatase